MFLHGLSYLLCVRSIIPNHKSLAMIHTKLLIQHKKKSAMISTFLSEWMLTFNLSSLLPILETLETSRTVIILVTELTGITISIIAFIYYY